MKKYIFLFSFVFTFCLQAGEFLSINAVEKGIQEQVVAQSSSSNFITFSLQANANIPIHMRNAAVATQSIPNGLSSNDELHHQLCTMQLSGDLLALQERLTKAEAQIRWYRPMGYERAEAATIKYLLDTPVMKLLTKIQKGSLVEARRAFSELREQCKQDEIARNIMGYDVHNYTQEQLQQGVKLIHARGMYGYDRVEENARMYGVAPVQEKPKVIAPSSQAQTDLSINIQPQIITALETSANHDVLIDKFNTTKDAVYSNAHKYHYVINSTVDYRIQAAINGLPLAENPREFAFHVATLDHLLHDIQLHTAQGVNVTSSIVERSPELLARAITKYVEYLAPTENEIICIVDLAKYISDATIGSSYLTPAVKELRIKQFWASISKLSELTPESVIDNCAYAAARATWALGFPRVVGVLKNIKDVASARAATAATGLAQRFAHIFDQVISHNPAIITSEGNVIMHASSEAAAESRQLIQAFEGMKDSGKGKVPREILDDSTKVVERKSEIEAAKKISVGTDKPHTFTDTEIERAVDRVMRHGFDHIFKDPKHKLEPLITKLGSEEQLVRSILKAVDGKLPYNGFIENMPVSIEGCEVCIRGRIMDGFFKLGTFFIR